MTNPRDLKVEIVHAIPGRLRLRIHALQLQPELAEHILSAGMAYAGVHAVRINLSCASVVVEYDQAVFADIAPQSLINRWLANPPQADGNSNPTGRTTQSKTGRLLPLVLTIGGALLTFFGGPIPSALALAMTLAGTLPIFRRAAIALISERRLNVDQLDTSAVAVMIAMGDVRGAALMSGLVALGEEIRERTARKSLRAALDLRGMLGRSAWLVNGEIKVRIAVDKLQVNDVVVVYPGDLIPVDGMVTDGAATVDQKTLTGESRPTLKTLGERVFAATVVTDGKLYVKAEAVGAGTRAGWVAQTLEQIPVHDTRATSAALHFADRLVAPTFALAGLVYWITGNPARSAAILIADFVTGIRVSAPTAILAGMARAARDGVLIKSGRALEQLAIADAIVFDKTGTLTHGEPQVHEVLSLDAEFPSEAVLAIAAAAEIRLRHPAARALVRHARQRGIPIPERQSSRYTTGLGVQAQVEGRSVHVGSARFMEKLGVDVDKVDVLASSYSTLGSSIIYVAINGALVGLIAYNDPPRPESAAVIQWLREHGVQEILMVTGDERGAADAVAGAVSIRRIHTAALPDDKAAIVRDLQQRGHVVAVVGDGINDSPALAHADVSISLSHGADVAQETADVILMGSDLWHLTRAITLARECMGLIRQNLVMVSAANASAMALAAVGALTPLGSTLLSNGSVVLAGVNSLRPLMSSSESQPTSAPEDKS